MNSTSFAASLGALVWASCLACSAQQVPAKETTTTPQQVEEKKIQMQGSLAGIGAVLKKNNDQIAITTVYPGSPAEKAGLKAGQIITAINAIPTATMTIDDAVKLIRGPKGTQVELTVTGSSDANTQRVAIVRDIVTLPEVTTTGHVLDGNVGFLTVPAFIEVTPKTVAGILQSFVANGVRGVVLDLRGNGGGSYAAVIEVTSLFAGKEPALWLMRMTAAKQVQPVHGTGNALWKGPLVVLVDGQTAFGAELAASALQTSERARVVGQKTFGKAARSSMESQPDGSTKVVVVAYFLTAGGDPIDGIGIQPDVPLDVSLSKEEALKKAVEVLPKQTDVKPNGNG